VTEYRCRKLECQATDGLKMPAPRAIEGTTVQRLHLVLRTLFGIPPAFNSSPPRYDVAMITYYLPWKATRKKSEFQVRQFRLLTLHEHCSSVNFATYADTPVS